MKVIIAGGRDFQNYTLLKEKCDYYLRDQTDIEVVSGGASGADKLGERWAAEYGHPVKKFPADWKKYGKAAGPIRNAEISKYSEALIAFWDNKSTGTYDMIEQAEREGMKVKIAHY